ncbi:NAC domain-containing protein 78-like [Vicia villosa]|uniref:NAC domain-containing protein 78-like n=1 Tax=Vicia villosa TaxID=3911 RepID=UPI00273AC3C5|nr:NAC domain-containing protein 78-like [Vicia villosa]
MSIYQAPGFRFHPTDEEIVCFYLKRKLTGHLPFRFDHLAVVDIYKFEPWDLPSLSKLKNKDLEWYFFTVLDKKYGNSSRTNRATDRGYWKTTGKDRLIKNGQDPVGMKKTLVYHLGRAPHGDRTNWVMHEYRMIAEELAKAGVQDAYVLCRIFEKSGPGPKNGEKYGAPFVEAEWENIIDGRQVDSLPPVDNELLKLQVFDEQVYPLTAVDSERSKDKVPAPTDDDYFETNDLDQELDTSITFGSADLPSNFCYGECSSHSQPFVNDHKQVEAALGIYDSQIGLPNNMADLYGVDINSVQDGYNGETNNNETPLNFNFESEDPDLYFDASGYLMSLNEEYVDANDVKNLDGVIPSEVDPSVAAILDEYLTCPDEDISKYICFDSPLNVESESPIANHGLSFIEQQNMEGETNGSILANKHVFDEQSSNENVLPKEDLKVSNWISGDANAFVKQANNLLARIPAPPAFASEFPTKEFAIGSSNSAHITAGMSMISITDITFGDNAMDWMVGKNGGFHTIMSSGFPQTDVNSATLVPTSGLVCSKTAFMLSHGWVFLMGFSVVILSLSFKIGSFMYTVK